MKSILYFSEYCQFCNGIIQSLSQTTLKENIHFINIDKRIVENNELKVILDNMQTITLPDCIKRVPSLMYENEKEGIKLLVGNDIKNYIFERLNKEKEQQAKQGNISNEPESYVFNLNGMFVHSDYFSFLDQSSDELSAKGDGGLRQMYNYATYNLQDSIQTPDEDYVPDTIKDVSLEKLIQQRDEDMGIQNYTKPSLMPR
jgi:hypothetical protein